MNPSTYPSNSESPTTSASPTTAAPAAASPTKAPSSTRSEQREATADAIKDKPSDVPKRLGQRWKQMFNLKAQLQRHPVAAVISGVSVILAIGSGITIGVLANQHRKNLSYRLKKRLQQVENQLLAQLH